MQANQKTKGRFEKMFLDGRPPVAVGVTSGGDLFGGTQVTFSDVLGDQQFNVFAASVSQYRTFSGSYVNLAGRLQYAIQGFSQTQFFYGYYPGALIAPGLGFLDRDQAIATRTAQGGSAYGIYPLNRYTRLELFGGVTHFNEKYDDPALEQLANEYQMQVYGTTVFRNGTSMPLGATLVRETTVFREFGPLAGDTVRLSYDDCAEGRRLAVEPDRRRRCAVLPPPRGDGAARVPGSRLQELGRAAEFLLLRRQL